MAGRELAATVIVDGITYSAGSTPPAEVAERITNPRAWGQDDAGATPDGAAPEGEGGNGTAVDTGSTPDPEDGPTAPPRSGAGSGRDEWAAYAETLGLDLPADAGRDDIIAAVDAAAS